MYRKSFLKLLGLSTGALLFTPQMEGMNKRKKICFGVMADLHQDIMHDGPQRLKAFIQDMEIQKPDFIIQLGDFCRPYNYNKVILDIYNRFPGPRYHVIGNHDMDGGFTREQVVDFWKATGKYYSFDSNGFHFVVLDGNDLNESKSRPSGYARFISNEQLAWLEKDLKSTSMPTIVCCHQGLDNDAGGLENGTLVRYTLEQANKKCGFQKVILVLSGHHHQDYYNHINVIHYVQITSASYQWLGDKHQKIRYSTETDKTHPWIKYTVPYKDPLWAMIEIEPRGMINIKGRTSSFVGWGMVNI